MKLKLVMLAALGGFVGASAPAFAEIDGNAFRGKAYAGSMCAACHALSADEAASADPTAPAFGTFVIEAKTGDDFIEWFNAEHPQVHTPQPKPEQAQDILAYIETLPAPE